MPTNANSAAYPLSVVQASIWQAQKARPNNPNFNIAQYTEINGAVDPIIFEKALRQVVMEAETLRLQFIESEDGVQQRVGSPDWSMLVIDVSAETDPQASAMAWMKRECRQAVNLLQGPFFHYALFKVTPNRFFWYHRYHHIVIDGFGRTLIIQRVAQVYSALIQNATASICPFRPISKLLENDVHYRNSTQYIEDEEYWVKHCVNLPEPVSFTDQHTSPFEDFLNQTTYVDNPDICGLVARDLAALTAAAMAAYLHQFRKAQDVILGLMFKARVGEDRFIPGLACNQLPLRLTVQSDMSLSALAEQTAQKIREGLPHQRYRCQDLRRALKLKQNQRIYGPTINLMPADCNPSFGEHSSATYSVVTGGANDIWLTIYNPSHNRPLRIDFSANPNLYTMDGLLTHQGQFLKFLYAFVDKPNHLIGSIDLR